MEMDIWDSDSVIGVCYSLSMITWHEFFMTVASLCVYMATRRVASSFLTIAITYVTA